MRIELKCAVCGNNHFSLEGDLSDECQIICKDCGHEIGTLGQLKAKVAAEVLERSLSAPPA